MGSETRGGGDASERERVLNEAISLGRLEAQEEERSRLAEELHDGTAQAISNAILQTEIVETVLRREPDAAAAEVARLRRLLQRELETLRAYISQLRPPLAEPGELAEALQEAAANLTEFTGIPVDVRLDGDPSQLEPTARTAVLRVAQEALRNIGKHSGAKRAWLTTRIDAARDGDTWELEVGDDGRGFDPEAPLAGQRRRHFGLRFMKERAGLLGADLRIETEPGAGTVIRLGLTTTRERS